MNESHVFRRAWWRRAAAAVTVLAAAAWCCLAAAPARADAVVEGYPYFVKLLGGRDADMHGELQIQDMAVTASGDLIVVGHARSESLTITNDIRFTSTVHSDRDTGIILCMDQSGEWKWGVTLEGAATGVTLRGVAVDDTHAYVVGGFDTEVRYSRLKPSLGPDDPADSHEEASPVLDSYSGVPLTSRTGYSRGLVAKINLADGLGAGALQAAAGKGDNTEMHSCFYDVALHQSSVYVCGDVHESNQDSVHICDQVSAYNVEDGFLVAKFNKALMVCDWIVYGDDRGRGGGVFWEDSGLVYRHESDGAARGIAVDDAGNAYVCGSIGGGRSVGPILDMPAYIYYGDNGEHKSNGILTGQDTDGADLWDGVQSWFALKIDGDSGDFVAINYDYRNWRLHNPYNYKPFSVAHSIVIAGGQVYVGGQYNGFLEIPLHGAYPYIRSTNETIPGENKDGFLVRLDMDLEAENIIEIGTAGQLNEDDFGPPDGIYSLVADTTNHRLYAFGHFGDDASFNMPYSGSSIKMWTLGDQDSFMAAIDIAPLGDGTNELKWEWVRPTARLDSYQPPPNARIHASTIDHQRGRIYCAGRFDPYGDDNDDDGKDDQPMKMGTEAKLTQLAVTRAYVVDDFVSFLTAIDSEGDYFEQVILEIASARAETEISPGVGTFRYFKDSEILINAPAAMYTGAGADDFIAADASQLPADLPAYGTRYLCTGYTLGVGNLAETGHRYQGTLTEDTKIEFKWETQHKLTVASEIVKPADHGLLGEQIATLGEPAPATGVHWIKEGSEVGPQVTGVGGVGPAGAGGLRSRYALTAYVGTGNAPSSGTAFAPTDQRLQLGDGEHDYFVIGGPSSLTYRWTKQYEVRVRTSSPTGEEMPLTHVTDASGQADRAGTGDFWFDHGTALEVGSQLSNDATGLQLTGWEYATLNAFPATRHVGAGFQTHLTSIELGGAQYLCRPVASLTSPVAVTWAYDDIVYSLNAALGQPLDRGFLNATAVNAPGGAFANLGNLIDFRRAPALRSADDEDGAQIANGDGMHIYDSAGQRSWLLRPGAAMLEWHRAADAPGSGPVFTKVHTGFPGVPTDRQLTLAEDSGVVLAEFETPVDEPAAHVVPRPAGTENLVINEFTATFGLRWDRGGSSACGMFGLGYGEWDAEEGVLRTGAPVLMFEIDQAAGNPGRVSVMQNGDVLAVKDDFAPDLYTRASDWAEVSMELGAAGLTVTVDGIAVCENVEVDAFTPTPDWQFVFLGGRVVDNGDLYQEIRDVLVVTDQADPDTLYLNGGTQDLTGAGADHRAKIVVDKPVTFADRIVNDVSATFLYRAADGSATPADGMSFSYGDIADDWDADEVGTGSGLRVAVVAHDTNQIRVYYADRLLASLPVAIYARASDVDGAPVTIACSGGRLTVTFDGQTVCDRLAIPDWAPRADWRFAFGARCGADFMRQTVSEVRIQRVAGDLIADYYGNPAAPGDLYALPDPDPRRKHIAETPAVDLDPSGTDDIALLPERFFFRADIGATGTQLGRLAENGAFTCGMNGWSVLLFSQATIDGLAATGDLNRERLFVRLARTLRLDPEKQQEDWWDSDEPDLLKFADSAEIAARLDSVHDTAGRGAGYLLTAATTAPYNAALHNRDTGVGPIIPVNRKYYAEPDSRAIADADDLVVVWYANDPDYADAADSIQWPHQPVIYRQFHWPDQAPTPGNPTTKRRIVIASRLGSEGKDEAGNVQFAFAPERYADVSIYNQPDRALPGFNPNEEHALIAPSFAHLDAAAPPPSAYALRNDLNNDASLASPAYTSYPYVLVQYLDLEADAYRMAAYHVDTEDSDTTDTRLPQGNQAYTFEYPMEAGELVVAPYPLNLVIGATPLNNTLNDDNPDYPDGTVYQDGDPDQRTWFVDHKGIGWAVSGNGLLLARYYYPHRFDFWLDTDLDGEDDGIMVGDRVCWLPESGPDGNLPVRIDYPTAWPDDLPVLKAGETMTYSGGEFRADHPDAAGLPGVIGWSAGQVVYDDLNPKLEPVDAASADAAWTARIVAPLEERRVDLSAVPERLEPASGNVDVVGIEYRFNELTASLQRRVFFDSLTKELGIRGYLNDRTLGDGDLTASPPAVYVLEPNILTEPERDALLELGVDDPGWSAAVAALYALCLNPAGLAVGDTPAFAAEGFLTGLQPHVDTEGNAFDDLADPFRGLGPGLAVIPNQRFLDPADTTLPEVSYITLAENNDPILGDAPVSIHILKVRRDVRYRGSVKTILPPNAFDEKIVLRHTGDFGTHTGDLVYQWFIREEDGSEKPLPGAASPDAWQLFDHGLGKFQTALAGAGGVILRDNLVFVRYAHRNEANLGGKAPDETTDWQGTEWDEYFPDRTYTVDGVDYAARGEWAGAGNSPTVDGEFLPQLVMGWVKRVLDAINPYEARIREFSGDSPATYSSMIQQAGPRYEGPVALNPDKDVIENHGLIELYQTVLERAMNLSVNLSQPETTPGVTNAILLAATRVASLYVLLGNDAWADAMDPTIGIGTDDIDHGSLATSLFAFMNQKPTLLDEELALLRGVDTSFARPVYNRLFWNFTKEQGEAAYAATYNLTDVTRDGFIDEHDAMKLYPQGHGDAWGHYLSALKIHYDLLNHSYFSWRARSELYNLMDIVIPVDYFDERHFARTAAAKARTGAQVCRLTYQARYVDDPDGQWQGYTDTDEQRAWGVAEWGRRAGQGTLFDWLVANAMLPAEADESAEGIERLDRTTVAEIADISKGLAAVQKVVDDANAGLNPLGIHPDAVPFDINPARVGIGPLATTHFEQVAERARAALENARLAFDHANDQTRRLRQGAESTADLADQAEEQDLAFRNRLIELFGTPYPEHIGPGKPYPAGYDGPDILLYMYVDTNEIVLADEQASEAYDFDFGKYVLRTAFPGDPDDVDEKKNKIPKNDTDGLVQRRVQAQLKAFWNLIHTGDENTAWEIDPIEQFPEIENLTVPVSARHYTFQAPEEWGQRQCVGRLQQLISDMIVAEAQLEYSKTEYYFEQVELNAMWTGIQMQADLAARTLAAEKLKMETLIDRASHARYLASSLAWNEFVFGFMEKFVDIQREDFPDSFIIGMASSVPTFIKGQIGSLLLNALLFGPMVAGAALETDVATNEFYTARDEMQFDFELTKYEQEAGIREQLLEFNTALGGERLQYISALQDVERHQQLANQYSTALLEGFRILEERTNWNRRLARDVQQNRYHDMTLRLYRNEALAKFHTIFDLAARYVYLAAKAYDYETNFADNDPGSPVGLLTEIVRQRTLGAFQEGQPLVGPQGLADCLARLEANYAAVKGQMGFNNPQTETGRFSLRRERFRIKPDTEGDQAWRNQLELSRIDNLWNEWAFRHYCRPPAAYDPEQPLPGLIIRFPSEIVFRYNFFGHALGPGDHAYDPSNFATKIRSVGVWLTGYDNSLMAETPRVYLVPAGADIMAVPTDNDLRLRQWNIVNQRIPVPFPLGEAELNNSGWKAANDALNGSFSDIVRFSSFRAYHDTGLFSEDEMTYDSRLVGRSVWNTEWLLIIPGGTLLHDAEEGIERFIYGARIDPNDPNSPRDGNGVGDIKLFFQTYAHSGG